MLNKYKLLVVAGVSSIISLGFAQMPASADPLSGLTNMLNTINRAVGSVDSTVQQLDGTVKNVSGTVDNLTRTLGLQSRGSGGSVSEADTTKQILDIYQEWYKQLNPPEQEIISWLVMEFARGREVTFDTISSTEWFQQKPLQEQQLIGSLVFKLNEITKASANEKDRFLTYAFCVNSGSSNCNP
ncbi:hypothetical protein [Leptolyngbya sp. FACHB-711]|uniref:hypothetical protein n=1 Tax=Leptolyngbya sp. FACHB-711 TaxID=2692813 RepID=UPI00168659BF|nr:hypothetical protein [Leptolyngbya sp. FACHB-711]MBD2028198.1 hypothetical protein [Leptolyngbya sp. FACHB-711]